MRVLAVVPLYVPDSRVGAWLGTHELLRGLVASGHHVDVIPYLASPGRRYNVDKIQVWHSRDRGRLLEHADVVVSHAGDTGETHRQAIAKGKPSVRMVHGALANVTALDDASLVVANSDATAARLSVTCPVVVCHPPTDPAKFKTTPGDMITLVNLSAAKGGEVFWRTVRFLPGLKFLGVKGGHGVQIERHAPNVEIIGPTRRMRDDVYARTKLLLMPSQAETWGMTAVEAMHSGIPVLARHTPGLAESLGSAANWVDGNDPGRWAQAILDLLEPSRWSEASERSLERASELDPSASRAKFVAAVEALV